MNDLKYELLGSFKYALKGDEQDAGWIELSAPTTKNMKECAAIKQAFFQSLPKTDAKDIEALKELQDGKESKTEMLNGDEIIAMISASSDVSLAVVYANARELFCSGIALVDGEEKLTKPLMDKMTFEDFEAMTGQYIANFIIASSLKSMNNR